MFRKLRSLWLYGVLFLLVLLLINLRQSKITNYDCEICADKAGYFMYLPAAFFYGFEAENYPETITKEHGNGFQLDHEKNRVLNKYTCGIAVLQAPFYGIGFLSSKVFSVKASPFSGFYLFFINIGAAFYLVMGVYYLRKWLNYYVDKTSSLLSILVVFFGTHLYYYTVDESLMTHLYSFSLFSIVLYTFKTYLEQKNFSTFLFFCVAASLAILIRPTNFLFGLLAFFVDISSFAFLKKRLSFFLTPKHLLSGGLILFLVLLPQLIYWKYTYGHFIRWSYGEEGFTLWKEPRFATIWFSPQGGLFPYTPIILQLLVATGIMFRRRTGNGLLVLLSFLAISYVCASWTNPYFGFCNFGKRPIVEFLPILILPMAYFFNFYKTIAKSIRYTMSITLVAFIYYNLALTAGFDTCFPGSTWEWDKFYILLDNSVF